jgi:iron only hydrogenase large subunit-like protein
MEYDFIEIMACPSGCINGGGQLKRNDVSVKETIVKAEEAYMSLRINNGIQSPEMNQVAMMIYQNTSEQEKKDLFYTVYQAVEKKSNQMGVIW